MADFRKVWKFLHDWEGGYSDHPNDPGGSTNHGISLRWYEARVDPKATADTIRDLTNEEAKDIVEKYWWKDKPYYAIQDQDIADRYFGFVFNMGPRNGTRVLQRAVNKSERAIQELVVDGVLGPKTIVSVNSVFPRYLLVFLRSEAAAFYLRLIEARPAFQVFKRGWFRRANA